MYKIVITTVLLKNHFEAVCTLYTVDLQGMLFRRICNCSSFQRSSTDWNRILILKLGVVQKKLILTKQYLLFFACHIIFGMVILAFGSLLMIFHGLILRCVFLESKSTWKKNTILSDGKDTMDAHQILLLTWIFQDCRF